VATRFRSTAKLARTLVIAYRFVNAEDRDYGLDRDHAAESPRQSLRARKTDANMLALRDVARAPNHEFGALPNGETNHGHLHLSRPLKVRALPLRNRW
jgi:hypothetical protein